LVLDAGFPTNGFFALVDKVNAGQLLNLAANGIQVGEFLAGLFADDPTDKIIARIDRLEDVINKGFQDLGNLLNTEIQNVIANEDKLANEEAVAHAVTAERDLYDYKLTADKTYLALAGNESSLATAFLEQQTDPFYIGGLICAGNARIDYFRALEPDWAHDPVHVGEVNELINCLAGMRTTVQQTIESNHTVVETAFSTHSGDIHYFFSHFDKGEEISRFRSEAAAEQARLAGIGNELTFLSIPKFEQILNIWEDLRGTLVVAAPKQIRAGAPFDLTVTALDASGNIDANYRGTVALTTSDPSGRLPAVYTFTPGDKGVHTFTAGTALVTVGRQTITASDTVSTITASAAVVVTPRNRFVIVPPGGSFAPASAVPGAYGNTDINYQGTVNFGTSDTDLGVVLPVDYTFGATDEGRHTFAVAFTWVTTETQILANTDTANVGRFFARTEQDVHGLADRLHCYSALAWANKGLSKQVFAEIPAIV
jgi:hypothetical protein